MRLQKIKTLLKLKTIIITSVSVFVIIAVTVLTVVLLKTPGDEQQAANEPEDIPTMEIVTPYCNLVFPSAWTENLEVREFTLDGVLCEAFYSKLSGGEYALFTIFFGNAKEGELFGYLMSEGVETAVYIECYPQSAEEISTEEELETFYSMIEGINQVTQSIVNCEGYHAA